MAEETKPMSKRESMTERLKKKYPDREWADDEALFGQFSDDYDEYENAIGGYKEREAKLLDAFNRSPKNARFFKDLVNGGDPWINTIERLGIEGITSLINDPEKKEVYAEANKKHIERLAEEDRLKEEYEKNLTTSLELLEKIQQERGLSDDQIDAAYDLINSIANDAVVGKLSEQTIDMVLKAVNHDSDVANATDEGMIAGKNAKAEMALRKPEKGDGTPALGGANNSPSNKRQRRKTIFDYANDAN